MCCTVLKSVYMYFGNDVIVQCTRTVMYSKSKITFKVCQICRNLNVCKKIFKKFKKFLELFEMIGVLKCLFFIKKLKF